VKIEASENYEFCNAMLKPCLFFFHPNTSIFSFTRSDSYFNFLISYRMHALIRVYPFFWISFSAYQWSGFKSQPKKNQMRVLCGSDNQSSNLASQRKRYIYSYSYFYNVITVCIRFEFSIFMSLRLWIWLVF